MDTLKYYLVNILIYIINELQEKITCCQYKKTNSNKEIIIDISIDNSNNITEPNLYTNNYKTFSNNNYKKQISIKPRNRDSIISNKPPEAILNKMKSIKKNHTNFNGE